MDEIQIKNELNRLILNCQAKRTALQDVSTKNGTKKRRLTFSAGILSILSALTLTSAVVTTTPALALQMVSIGLAALGGIVALTASMTHGDEEIASIYSGISKFLSLREKANFLYIKNRLDSSRAATLLNELVCEYVELSASFDKYIPLSRQPSGQDTEQISSGSHPPGILK